MKTMTFNGMRIHYDSHTAMLVRNESTLQPFEVRTINLIEFVGTLARDAEVARLERMTGAEYLGMATGVVA